MLPVIFEKMDGNMIKSNLKIPKKKTKKCKFPYFYDFDLNAQLFMDILSFLTKSDNEFKHLDAILV